MPQVTISDQVHEALTSMKKAFEGLASVYLEIDGHSDRRVEGYGDELEKLDVFADRILEAALQQLRHDLLENSDKGTMLQSFLRAARKQ